MRAALLLLLSGLACAAQTRLDAARHEEARRALEPEPGDGAFRCRVSPLPPRLNFGFRYQAGYSLTADLDQFLGDGHRLVILTRITPQAPQPVPAYFVQNLFLPNVPPTRNALEIAGGLLFGEGRYHVDLVAIDDRDRVCRKSWDLEVSRRRGERHVPVALAPHQVAELSLRGVDRPDPLASGRRPLRLTILLHAAARGPRGTRLRGSDVMLLAGTLAALLEHVPARTVRLGVFNLEQRKVLYSNDRFSPAGLGDAATAMSRLELGGVDLSILQEPKGHLPFLAGLVRGELDRPEPSDAVVFLGPLTRYYEKPPLITAPRGSPSPRFFYFHFLPPMRGGLLPDSIDHAVRLLRGRRFDIYTPSEFAKAIAELDPPPSSDR